jgi:hypothetical protein
VDLCGGAVITGRGAPATRFGSRCAGLARVARSTRFWALGCGEACVTVAAPSDGTLSASTTAGSDAGFSSAGLASVAATGVAASLGCEASGSGDAACGAGDALSVAGDAASGAADAAVVSCNTGGAVARSVRVARYVAPATSATKHTVANATPGNKRFRARGVVSRGSTTTGGS